METHEFIAKLKANGSEKDWFDLTKCIDHYKEIIQSLSAKDKGLFSLNVLCTLIRNLDTVPTWTHKISTKELLALSIECVRQTRSLDKPEQVKTLGCVFRLHKHAITMNATTPPELVLKLSFMSFEYDDDSLLQEYYKTYGHIIIDRITYIGKLKPTKLPILKLLPKLVEDITKTIKIYDTVQFCTNMLTFVVKKLCYIYSESPKEVNELLGKIFNCISKNDLKGCKNLSEKDALDLYVKLNECLITITENSLKINFHNSVLDSMTRVCVSLLGHIPDMFHCFQTIFLNSFCCIFNDKTNPILIDNLLKNIQTSCEMTEKLGYKTIIYATYPFIGQLLRLYIERNVNIDDKIDRSDYLNEPIQENCLELVKFLIEKLKTTKQLTKCDNCTVKTGLHDALRLSFTVKHFITISTNKGIELKNNLLVYFTIVEQQYLILEELNTLRCPNQERCFRKLQIDVHNIAVILNKYNYYEYSIKLFEIYLKYELKHLKNDSGLKNVSRALYNKSICELDAKLYKDSLLNAYLSLVFSLPEGLKSEKYMSLVIDVKAKALKSVTKDVSDEINELQSMSILEACDVLYNDKTYGNLKLFLKNPKFSALLKHEYAMYIKLWPSTVPIAGVWSSLVNLTMSKHRWVAAEDKSTVLWALYEVVLETPTVVRNIHDDRYKAVVLELVNNFQNALEISIPERIIYGTTLLLKSEYDMAEASQNFGWKVTEHTTEPDQDRTVRTMQQENNAIGSALQAVELLSDVVQGFEPGALSNTTLRHIAQIACVSVQQLLHLHMFACALQLAYVGCCFAEHAGDKETYILHASTLIYHSVKHKQVDVIVMRAMRYANELMTSEQNAEAALCLLCDVAIYYIKSGCLYIAGKLIQTVQLKLLSHYEKQRDVNLELSMGRLLEAQAMLCPDSGLSMLSAVNGVHRHFLAARNTAARWTLRRTISLYIKNGISSHGCASVRAARRLALWRRANCAAAVTLPPASATTRTRVYADIINTHDVDAQGKISLRLKSILKSNEPPQSDQLQTETTVKKLEHFTPAQDNVEIMLDCMFKKTQCSPSLSSGFCAVPAFQIPDFLQHAKSCSCYACTLPACSIIACQIGYLEASTYFRAKETEIAENYFEGARKTFVLAEEKLKNIFISYKMKKFNNLAVDIAWGMVENEFRTIQLEFLIEISLFELTRNEFAKSDDHAVSIHEILAEFRYVDGYLRNEVSNLMVASANLRKTRIVKETGLEIDMEELKLSPDKLKTPESKIIPKICNTIKVVKAEELPEKFKLLKVNLDFDEISEKEDQTEVKDTEIMKPITKPSKFKVPVPVTSKPMLENFTPKPSRAKPKIVFTLADNNDSHISTPHNATNLEFFTPCQTTPSEFFTPMSSIRTYTKKRTTVAKNLETEFLTPKGKEESSKVKVKENSRTVNENFRPAKDLRLAREVFKTTKDSRHAKEDLRPAAEEFLNSKEDLRHVKEDLRPAKADLKLAKGVKVMEDLGRRTRSKVETGTVKGLNDKRTIKRATSPGKLVEENTPVSRARRVKRPGFDEK